MEVQKHIRCVPGDVGKHVFIPGDQTRAKKIAEKLDNVKLISENRALQQRCLLFPAPCAINRRHGAH